MTIETTKTITMLFVLLLTTAPNCNSFNMMGPSTFPPPPGGGGGGAFNLAPHPNQMMQPYPPSGGVGNGPPIPPPGGASPNMEHPDQMMQYRQPYGQSQWMSPPQQGMMMQQPPPPPPGRGGIPYEQRSPNMMMRPPSSMGQWQQPPGVGGRFSPRNYNNGGMYGGGMMPRGRSLTLPPLMAATSALSTDEIYSDLAEPVNGDQGCTLSTTNPTTKSAAITSSSSSALSAPAKWHQQRRKQMISKYGNQITSLERNASSQSIALPLLLLTNLSLLGLSLWCGLGNLSFLQTFGLAMIPGSMFSLWQLQILHDCLHGSLFDKQQSSKIKLFGKYKISRKQLQDALLFYGSMPSTYGYYTYLKYGHLTHHSSLGDEKKATLGKLFDSSQKDFEDGDILFVAHRMKLKGEIGPVFKIPTLRFPRLRRSSNNNKTTTPRPKTKEFKMSISKSGFNQWKVGKPIRNYIVFASSFLFERFMITVNDVIVALTGRNSFFPNKPLEFHKECTAYCRVAVLLRLLIWRLSGSWKSLLFLFLSETLWSIPPHPSCAMFVTNHGSKIDSATGECTPSSSTYAGKWYSLLTLGTNYHCEHHDFPTIPLNKLGKLREIAPEFYKKSSDDNVFRIMRGAFSDPDFYACLDAGVSLVENE